MDNQAENKTTGENSGKVPQFSVGTVLREAREQLGLSVADVANRIKFAPRQIESMEADDFSHLPEMPFVRGFVRSYARLLEIDAAPLLAALPQKHLPLLATTENKPVEVPFPSLLTSRRSNMIWLSAALFVAVVLIIFSRMHDTSTGPAQPVSQVSVETLELPVAALAAASAPVADVLPVEHAAASNEAVKSRLALPARAPVVVASSVKTPANPMQPAKDNMAMDKPLREKPVKVAPEVVAQSKPVKEKIKSEQAATAPADAAQKSAATTGGAASGYSSVRLVFDEDSWVDVKDANGKILLSKMNHAGSLVRLSGVAPLSVVIGHASGVHLFFEGKKVDLAPHTSVEVARLVLE